MFETNFLKNTSTHKVTDTKGIFSIVEYVKDVSVGYNSAMSEYFASEMNIRKKQLVANVKGNTGVVVQSGEMQMMIGEVHAKTNVKGAGDLVKKFIGSKVTNESAIKPRYTGNGLVVMEPSYKYILLEDLSSWNGNMVVEDGMFLACEDTVNIKVAARKTLSSIMLGNEGLFNTMFWGTGIVALESYVPREELIEVELNNDTIKIDGDMAVAWSDTLDFTVERTTNTLVGSAASGEGLVNVYRGTGKILVAPHIGK